MAAVNTSTRGWKFNQVGIRVSNLEKSLFFYQAVLGMTELARVPADSLTLVLLGFPEAGGADVLMTREGVLELVYSEASKNLVTNAQQHPDIGFVKLGITVPNLADCVARLREYEVPILKLPGTTEAQEVVAQALGADSSDKGRDKGVWEFVKGIALVEDPDRYLIELMQY